MKPAVHGAIFGLFSSLAFILEFLFNMLSILWHFCFTKILPYYLPKQTVENIQLKTKLSEELKDKNPKKFTRKELLGGDIEWIQDSQDILKLPSEDDFINHISRLDHVCSIDNLELDCKRRNNHYRLTTGVEVRDHPLRRSISAKENPHECSRFKKVIEEMKDIVIESSRLQKDIEEIIESSRLQKDIEEIIESSRLQKDIEEIIESSRLQKDIEDIIESSRLKEEEEEDQNESSRLKEEEEEDQNESRRLSTEEIKHQIKSSKLKNLAMEDLTQNSRLKTAIAETEDLNEISEYQLPVEDVRLTDFYECSAENLIELKNSIDNIKKVFNPEEYVPSWSRSSLDYFEYRIKNKCKDMENDNDNTAEEETKILDGGEKNEDFKLKTIGGDARNSDSKRSSKSKESNEDLEVLIDKINEIVDVENSLEIVGGKLILRTDSASESNLKNMTFTISGKSWGRSCNGEENKGFCASLTGIDEEQAFVSRNRNFSEDFLSFQQLPEKSPDDDEDNFECVSLSSSSSQGSEVGLIKRHEKPPTFPAKMSAFGRQARTALSNMSTNKMKIESKASIGKLRARLKNL
ncbi:hypothetical protein JTE90_013206 [Oedothorax gibbosus]|uniref:Uncharacterized protein n=1 Tax=Oedothorax gibbosus TaxID=931172 RepID=A0AAV6UII6_9ARAC|nr:hypothetical protein JTE90_013206 [Oedothorax gibbosus]